ncbi:MAG: GNAT family N-acetyltransferase [Lachnospiraceae bacterium]|nr:GNAT family N-acetyltransferase [Lachnospiraceae bacterium]
MQERNKGIILETARCYLREITAEDVPARFELYNSPHMTDFIEPLLDIEEETEYQRRYVEMIYGEYGYGMWGVFDKVTDRLIGEAGLEHRTDINREKFPYDWMFDDKCDELGFCFAEDLWGQGYCTEVCRAILRYGTDVLRHNCFFARAEKENAASVRVLEKLGFKNFEGDYYRLIIGS